MPPLQDGPLTTDKLRQALGDDVEPPLRRMAKSGALHCKRSRAARYATRWYCSPVSPFLLKRRWLWPVSPSGGVRR